MPIVPTVNTTFSSKLGALRKKSAPPNKSAEPQLSTSPSDGVSVSSQARESKRPSGLWTTAVLGGLAAVSLAGCVTAGAVGPATAPTVAHVQQATEGAPVEILRTDSGEVVINLGLDDQVVNPDTGETYQAPGANEASWSQRGETICQQALDLGGRCDAENIALVPTPHGTLIIEQNESNTLDVYSQDGGHTGVNVQADGIGVQTYKGSTYFGNDGAILRR